MKLKVNPFQPDNPVSSFEQFAGRADELRVLIDSLYQLGHGNPKYKIVTGARGIGKSSFINQIRALTVNHVDILRELEVDAGDFTFQFEVFDHIAARGHSTEHIILSLIRMMKDRLTRDSYKRKAESFLSNWTPKASLPGGLVQVEYSRHSDGDLITDLISILQDVWCEVKETKDGIILIIDEIDTVAEETDIASFLKIMTERLSQLGLNRVALYPVGITNAVERLQKEHGSIGRVFETIELMPMRPQESREVIEKSLRSGVASRQVEMTDTAISQVVKESGGFPFIIHQFCFHAYRIDEDDCIDTGDLRKAVRYVVTNVRRHELERTLQAAGSGTNRDILLAMAKHDEVQVPLKDIAATIGKKSVAMSSNMKSLQDRGAIARIECALYRIADPLLRHYIRQLGEYGHIDSLRDERQLRLPIDEQEA